MRAVERLVVAAELGAGLPDRSGQVQLRDGRVLGWSEWGPGDGVPVLPCGGAATSRRLGFGSHLVDELGVLLVALDRPGLGVSHPQSGRTLLDWADDVRQLDEQRALGLAGVVGFSQGGPFALAVAASGLVRAAAVVAGTDELARPEMRALLEPDVARPFDAVEADAEAVEQEVCRAADAASYLRMVLHSSSPLDLQVYEQPVFADALSTAVAEALARGGSGYARDLVLSPDRGLDLSRRLPRADHHLIPDAGGSLLWTHAKDILRVLLDHLSTRPIQHPATRQGARRCS